VLDEKLVQDCIEATGIKTQKALIDHALRELLRHEKQIKILELMGKITSAFTMTAKSHRA